jgi:hypothetical protein
VPVDVAGEQRGRGRKISGTKRPPYAADEVIGAASLRDSQGWRLAWPRPSSRQERTPGALLADELLAQDVGVPAVLSELAQHVEVYPAQRERAAPVAVDDVVQAQG